MNMNIRAESRCSWKQPKLEIYVVQSRVRPKETSEVTFMQEGQTTIQNKKKEKKKKSFSDQFCPAGVIYMLRCCCCLQEQNNVLNLHVPHMFLFTREMLCM